MAFYQRHFAEAAQYHQQALDIRRAIGDRAGTGESLYNLALVAREMGDYAQASAYLSQSLSLQQTIGNRWEELNICRAGIPSAGLLRLLSGLRGDPTGG